MKHHPPLLVMIRPEPLAKQDLQTLAAAISADVEGVILPVASISYLAPVELPDPSDQLVFASVHGVKALTRLKSFAGAHCYCVGQKTAEAAADQGLRVKATVAQAQGLAAILPKKPTCIIRGTYVATDLCGQLNALSVPARECVVYQQSPLSLAFEDWAALEKRAWIVPVFSQKSGEWLIDALSQDAMANAHVIAISQRVASAFSGVKLAQLGVVDYPNRRAMLQECLELYRKLCDLGPF